MVPMMLERSVWDDDPPVMFGERKTLIDGTSHYVLRHVNGAYENRFRPHDGLLSLAFVFGDGALNHWKGLVVGSDRLVGVSIVRLSSDGWPEEVVWTRGSINERGEGDDHIYDDVLGTDLL